MSSLEDLANVLTTTISTEWKRKVMYNTLYDTHLIGQLNLFCIISYGMTFSSNSLPIAKSLARVYLSAPSEPYIYLFNLNLISEAEHWSPTPLRTIPSMVFGIVWEDNCNFYTIVLFLQGVRLLVHNQFITHNVQYADRHTDKDSLYLPSSLLSSPKMPCPLMIDKKDLKNDRR